MSRIGGNKNFGFGKQVSFAVTNALKDKYGEGKYRTREAHHFRFGKFADHLREEHGIRDMCMVTADHIKGYGKELAIQVATKEMSVSYAHNLLSSVNTVMQVLRKDRELKVSPSKVIGKLRSYVRTTPPAGMDKDKVRMATETMRSNGDLREASVIELTREFGMRLKEACLFNPKEALKEALKETVQQNAESMSLNVTEGTKGGRGKDVDRFIPVTKEGIAVLQRAVKAQEHSRNLIFPKNSLKQFMNRVEYRWGKVRDEYDLKKIHDLRAAYACDRYKQATGVDAPCIAGSRQVSKDLDKEVRMELTKELGHYRFQIVSAYIGGRK